MSGNNILSLLGLALRGGRLAVGEEPAALAAKTGQARLLLAASDAAGNTLRRMEHLAQEGHCLYLSLPFSKAELGGALGRGSAAIAALTDTGLAAAVTERLAALDPERYAEAAARMDLKRRRAKERQEAPRRNPPKRDPPPSGKNHRPSRSRREGDRFPSPGGARRPEGRRDGPERRERSWSGERTHSPGEKRRSYSGKQGGAHFRSELPKRSRKGGGPNRPSSGRPPQGKPGPGRGRDGGR